MSIGTPRVVARSIARCAMALRVSGVVLILFRLAFLMGVEVYQLMIQIAT